MNETLKDRILTKKEQEEFQALFLIAQQVIVDLVEQEARLELTEEQEAPLEWAKVQKALLDLTKEGMVALEDMWNLILIYPPVPEDPDCRPEYRRTIPLITTEDPAPEVDRDDGPEV